MTKKEVSRIVENWGEFWIHEGVDGSLLPEGGRSEEKQRKELAEVLYWIEWQKDVETRSP